MKWKDSDRTCKDPTDIHFTFPNLSLLITDRLHTSGSELIIVPTPPLSIYPLTKPHNGSLPIWPRVLTANCRHNSNLISKPNNWSLLDMFGFVEGLALQSKIAISDITPEEAVYWYRVSWWNFARDNRKHHNHTLTFLCRMRKNRPFCEIKALSQTVVYIVSYRRSTSNEYFRQNIYEKEVIIKSWKLLVFIDHWYAATSRKAWLPDRR